MKNDDWLTAAFEENRSHLQAVAYRLLGSLSEADDAVQEAWLHLGRADASSVSNLGAWLTTVVARISLNMLRSRKTRREESLQADTLESIVARQDVIDPEQEAELADSVGLALLVVLDTLTPAERLAYVLHDIFDVPFEEIAPIVERGVDATRQLASRARRRIRGGERRNAPELVASREVVDAFLAASREGNFEALLAVLDPDVVYREEGTAHLVGSSRQIRGAAQVAKQLLGRHPRHPEALRPALVNGAFGVVVAPYGHLLAAATLSVVDGKIAEIHVISDLAMLHQLHLAVLPDDKET